ncbi:uncharacterized protein TNCV_942611 [Trichonephila clavipes]|nr:uncharacterized protein TNCV_942611 [Trichonephila clavipes]
MPRRDGLYVILTQRSPSSYEIASLDNPGEPLGVYHTSALTPCNNHKVKPLIPLRKRGRPAKAVDEWYRYRTVACLVTSSSPVPLKSPRVGQRCTLNLSRAETSSRWCGVVVRRGGCQLRRRPRHLTMVQNDVAESPRVAK